MTDVTTKAPTGKAEVYVKQPNADILAKEEARVAQVAKRAEAAAAASTAAGLTALAEQDQVTLKAEQGVAWCKARGLMPMKPEELEIWQRWLPVCFTSRPECLIRLR
jgi:hypothetical protein